MTDGSAEPELSPDGPNSLQTAGNLELSADQNPHPEPRATATASRAQHSSNTANVEGEDLNNEDLGGQEGIPSSDNQAAGPHGDAEATRPTTTVRPAADLARAERERVREARRNDNATAFSNPPIIDWVIKVWRSRRKAPRRLKFTREGKFFVGITLGVGFAAINTNNNLLYLMLGLLLALIVVSGVMSELSLRDLFVVRKLPARAQVGKPHVVEIEVFNRKNRIPSYAIEVEDLREGLPADKRCFFLKISPESAQVAAYRRTPSRRGRDRHTGFRLATRFPFGLFEKSRELTEEGELIIYPAVDLLNVSDPIAAREDGVDPSRERGRGEETLDLRHLRDGEDAHDIHWKASARAGQLVIRERARDARPEVGLKLDVIKPDDASAEWAPAFERRIREVASRIVAHLRRGNRITLRLSTGATLRADRTTGADGILRYLALLEPTLQSTTTGPHAASGKLAGLPSSRHPRLAPAEVTQRPPLTLQSGGEPAE